MIEIQKKYHFYAAHRNKAGGEKCGRIHGHTYNIVCHFNTGSINEGGVTILFSDIDAIVEPIIKSHCHWLLLYKKDPLVEVLSLINEPYKEMEFETSAENLCIYFFILIKNAGLPITKIELGETLSSNVIYEQIS